MRRYCLNRTCNEHLMHSASYSGRCEVLINSTQEMARKGHSHKGAVTQELGRVSVKQGWLQKEIQCLQPCQELLYWSCMATNVQSLLCARSRLTSLSEQLAKLEQVSQVTGTGPSLLLSLTMYAAKSWGAHLRLLVWQCRGPALNCSHSKQANTQKIRVEAKTEIQGSVVTCTRPWGKAGRGSSVHCVLPAGCPGFLHKHPLLPFSGEVSLGYCVLQNNSCKTMVEFWVKHLLRSYLDCFETYT